MGDKLEMLKLACDMVKQTFPHNNPSPNSAQGRSSFFSNTPGILVLVRTDNAPSSSVLDLIEAEYHTELEPNPLATHPRYPPSALALERPSDVFRHP
jgi:hypothetical protein